MCSSAPDNGLPSFGCVLRLCSVRFFPLKTSALGFTLSRPLAAVATQYRLPTLPSVPAARAQAAVEAQAAQDVAEAAAQAALAEGAGAAAAQKAAVASAKSVVAQHDARVQARRAVAGAPAAAAVLGGTASPACAALHRAPSGWQPLLALHEQGGIGAAAEAGPPAGQSLPSAAGRRSRLGIRLELEARPLGLHHAPALQLRCMLTWHLPL